MTRTRLRLIIGVAAFLAAITCVCAVVLVVRSMASFGPQAVTDPSRYEEVLRYWEGTDVVDHFPRAIPENARNPRLYHIPRFLMGGASLQLRVQLPPAELEEIVVEYAPLATHQFIGGDVNEHVNEPGGVPTTFFHTSGTDDLSFPKSFTIFVLRARPYGDEEHRWNHGDSCGLAIDQDASEVVFWADYW